MFILVTYDIPETKRRTKLAKILLAYGERVQYSVFECNLTAKQRDAMQKEIEKLISVEKDSVRIYQLCAECAKIIKALGKADGPLEDPTLYLV